MFYIHETPSLFIILSNTITNSQIKGQDWNTASGSKAGTAWYRSFAEGLLVHRVCNADSIPFHVNDIEILSAYDTNSHRKPLPFKVSFENNRAIAYQLSYSSFGKKMISGRGPLVAELVTDNAIIFHDIKAKKTTHIKTGGYLYIQPDSSFYFSNLQSQKIMLALFEIK